MRDFDQLPLSGCLTGFTLPVENFEIGPGLQLRKTVVDVFGGGNMGFATPSSPSGSHLDSRSVIFRLEPERYSTVKAHVEIVVTKTVQDFTLPTAIAWLVASLLRLRINAPIKLAVIANTPFDSITASDRRAPEAMAFEIGRQQWGDFRTESSQATLEDLLWLRRCVLVAARLYQDERFQRAYSIYDEALWAPRKELATVLVWTALEILFAASGEQNKTRAISELASDWIGYDRPDRDRAYNVIRELYHKRGRVVHMGRQIETPRT
jgi:Apea-like HEPN